MGDREQIRRDVQWLYDEGHNIIAQRYDDLATKLEQAEVTWKNQQAISRDEMKRSDEYQEAYRRAEADVDSLKARLAQAERDEHAEQRDRNLWAAENSRERQRLTERAEQAERERDKAQTHEVSMAQSNGVLSLQLAKVDTVLVEALQRIEEWPTTSPVPTMTQSRIAREALARWEDVNREVE